MKLKKIFALLSLPSLFFFASCEKEETEPDPEFETTFKLSEDQAISESINDDATVVFFEASVGAGLYRVNGTVEIYQYTQLCHRYRNTSKHISKNNCN